MNVYETLMLAADLIEERGWRQGAGWVMADPDYDSTTGLCLEGGIMAAAGIALSTVERDGQRHVPNESFRPLWLCPAYRAVSDYLELEFELTEDGPRKPLYSWNDRSQRTAAEVIETLRAAAATSLAKDAAREHAATGAEREAVRAS